MTHNDIEYTVFSGDERVKTTILDLPDELIKWIEKNQELVKRIHTALSDVRDELTEEQLWKIITVESHSDLSFAKFKLVNKGLEERDDLKKLLQIFKIINRITDNSIQETKNIKDITNELSSMNIKAAKSFSKSSLKIIDSKNSTKPIGINAAFKLYAKELLRKKSATSTRKPPVL